MPGTSREVPDHLSPEMGLVKLGNFSKNPGKCQYASLLTFAGPK